MTRDRVCSLCGRPANRLIPSRVRGVGFCFLCPKCWLKLLQEGKLVYGTACSFRENLVSVLEEVKKDDVSDFS